ncbi:7998_t:CDS:1, partial [Paraglomus brasilianum]
EIYKLAYNLAESEPTKIAKPSRLKLLRKDQRKLRADYLTIEATYIPDITYASNKKQRELQELREDKGFYCPDFFALEKVREQLQKCDI